MNQKDNKKTIKSAVEKEEKIKKGMKIFIGALAGGFMGAIICLLWAFMFVPAETFTDRISGIEIGLFSGAIIGATLGGFLYKASSILAAALGWAFGMDIDV